MLDELVRNIEEAYGPGLGRMIGELYLGACVLDVMKSNRTNLLELAYYR